MPELTEVCPLAELPPGCSRVIEWEDLEVGVFNCGGTIYAMENRCSHDDGPLADETFEQLRCTIECPRPGSKFDLRTGQPLMLPAYIPVETFPVVIEDGVIKVALDKAPWLFQSACAHLLRPAMSGGRLLA